MTFGQLDIFVTLAETRGFTAAALRLGISQPAVSHALKSLEDELGITLFNRTVSPIELTPLGERLLSRAREILGLADAMHQEASEYRGVQTGRLRIGSFGATSSLQILPRLLEAFHAAHPGIEVLIEEAADDEIIRWIEDRRIDLGFVVLPDERFRTWPVAQDQFVALVAADSALAMQSSIRLEQLCEMPFIMPESGSARIIRRLFTQARLSPNVRYRTSQMLSTLTMVARNQGVSVVAEMALPPTNGKEGWVSKPLNSVRTRKIGLAMHPHATPSPAAVAFVEVVKKSRDDF